MVDFEVMRRRTSEKFDTSFLAGLLSLLVFGVIAVYDASVVYSHEVFGGRYHFLFLQLAWVALGTAVFLFFWRFDYRKLNAWAPTLFFVSLVPLLLVLIPSPFSSKVYGARRWLTLNPQPLPSLPLLGRLSFQPAELVKLTFITYLASFLSRETGRLGSKKRNSPRQWKVLFSALVLGGLVLLQPDFATLMILVGIGLAIYFLSGAPLFQFLVLLPAIGGGALAFILSSDYRRQRLSTFLNPSAADPQGAGYHLRQILISIGSGGLTGLGLGQSRQKYGYLPEVQADSIFAVICEEVGFLGALAVMAVFLFLIYKTFQVSKGAQDQFGKLLAGGVATWITVQTMINLAAMVGVVPLTGVPLPFVSYGGSSMIFLMAAMGVVFSVGRKARV